MANTVAISRAFSFRLRPIPVPGDLRIAWRVALILLMLGNSRSGKATLAKLHILNDAIRSNNVARLTVALDQKPGMLPWHLRVEPAFARAIDFAVGEGLAHWGRSSDRTALELTDLGKSSFEALCELENVLADERKLLELLSKKMTETAVSSLLAAGRSL